MTSDPPATDLPERGCFPKATGVDLERRRRVREFFLALRRGVTLGHCRTCETFYLMARLCRDECGDALGPGERGDVSSWVEGGALLDLEFGCEGACAVVPLYSRTTR